MFQTNNFLIKCVSSQSEPILFSQNTFLYSTIPNNICHWFSLQKSHTYLLLLYFYTSEIHFLNEIRVSE